MVTGQNIDLDQGKIELNVYVDGNAVESEDDIIVSFAYAVEPATISGDSESGYTITQKVLPTQMADTLTVSCTLKNGNTHTYTTSVKQYAQEAKTLGKLKENEQDVVDAMLDYGSAVQALVTSATGDSLANGGTYQEDNINNVTATSIATKSTTGSDLDNWNGATLQSMKMNFNYNFNLGLTYTQSLEDYTITVAGDGTTTITNGTSSDSSKVVLDTDSNSIVIKGLTAAQLTSTLVITLSDGTNTYQTTTTPLYYARLLADTDTENIKGSANSPSEAQQLLGKMLYLYANAVKSLNTQTSEEE